MTPEERFQDSNNWEATSDRPPRRPYRPPIGIPGYGEPRAQATIASFLLHAAVILLILAPTLFVSSQLFDLKNQGAGGAGPSGGGGGGRSGSTGSDYVREGLRYFSLTRQPPAVTQKNEITPPKPEEKKKEPDLPKPKPAPDLRADSSSASKTAAATEGSGGGTGKGGSAGNGSGSGGGTGSGAGTGRGSGNGPGTGGGDDSVFPPTVISMQLLPLPVPSKVRPYTMVAYFEVDTTGVARLLSFNPSKDGNYNKRVREMLMEMRFRPAVRGNGVPVKDTAVVTAEAR